MKLDRPAARGAATGDRAIVPRRVTQAPTD